ncbi:Cilia- and flagella-associated protein 70 [Sparganum proliferum]
MEDDGSITFNHQFKFTFEEIDLASLNEFCNRPFVIDIFEAANVSKKSELKKQRIGAAVFDILPLIRESMQSLPDDLVSQASEYVHVATFRPFLEVDQPVVFSKSVISLPTEPVVHSGKKWMLTDGTVPDPVIIPGSESKSVETQFYEEVGELQEEADREHRYQSEHNKPKLLWSQEWRAFLDFEMLQRMKEHISSSPLLPIEVIRLPSAENIKVKKESEYAITFHGIAFVDLFQLLEPGERKIRGAYLVHPFDDEEYKQKLNCVSTLAREAAVMHRVYEAAAAAQTLLNDSSGAQSSTPTARQLAAKKAVKEYHKAIIEISQIMLSKMSKQNLQCMLDESSMFALFKEQLKFPIVNLVREKFFRSTPFATPEEFQKFLSDLFVYLVREMLQSMMVAFSPARKICARSDLTARRGTTSELLLFAEEAEYTGALDWAHHYFQKLIVVEPHNADAWIDLAVFYLRQAKPEEAEECLRECLSIQDNNIKA